MMMTNVNDIPIPPRNFNRGFKLPPKIITKFESHPNDILIKFDPNKHVYSYDGKQLKTSVTSFLDNFFTKFNPDEVIPKMMNGQNWPRPEYTVQTIAIIT
jgi:hypothetical protein